MSSDTAHLPALLETELYKYIMEGNNTFPQMTVGIATLAGSMAVNRILLEGDVTWENFIDTRMGDPKVDASYKGALAAHAAHGVVCNLEGYDTTQARRRRMAPALSAWRYFSQTAIAHFGRRILPAGELLEARPESEEAAHDPLTGDLTANDLLVEEDTVRALFNPIHTGQGVGFRPEAFALASMWSSAAIVIRDKKASLISDLYIDEIEAIHADAGLDEEVKHGLRLETTHATATLLYPVLVDGIRDQASAIEATTGVSLPDSTISHFVFDLMIGTPPDESQHPYRPTAAN